MEAPCCNPQDTNEKMPTSQCQTLQGTPRGPISTPRQVRAVLAARGGSAQYLAGGFNVVADQCICVMSKYAWHELKHWPHHSIYISLPDKGSTQTIWQREWHTSTRTQIHTIHSKEEHYQEKKPVSFSHPGIWNLIFDLTEKLPSDLCWVHSLTTSVCNFDIWLQSKDSWSHTRTRFSFHGLLLQTLSCFLHVFQPDG